MQTVVCIRWGTAYGADDVNRLHRAVMRNVGRPTRFVSFTDPVEGLDPAIDARPIPSIALPPGLKPGPGASWQSGRRRSATSTATFCSSTSTCW